jgi:hypothetical protein
MIIREIREIALETRNVRACEEIAAIASSNPETSFWLQAGVRNKPGIPVSSRVTSIIRLECRRNKWSNHPPTLTIWRKQSSTAIHPYIVARTKSLATADLRYALYINQPPPVPPLRPTTRTPESLRCVCTRVLSERDFQRVFTINFPLACVHKYVSTIFSKNTRQNAKSFIARFPFHRQQDYSSRD